MVAVDGAEVSSGDLKVFSELGNVMLLLNVIRCVSTQYLGREDFTQHCFL
jgi:hypothetical protein